MWLDSKSSAAAVLACCVGVSVVSFSGNTEQNAVVADQVFRTSTQLVHLEVRAFGPDRGVVSDLAADEVSVFQDGKRQRIVVFAFVDERAQESYIHSTDGMRTKLKSATVTPVGRSRSELFLVDDQHMDVANLVRVRSALVNALRATLRSGSEAAVLSTTRGEHVVRLTSDVAELESQVRSLKGNAGWREALTNPAIRTLCTGELTGDLESDPFGYGTLAPLAAILLELKNIPGRKHLYLLVERMQTAPCPEYQWSYHERLRRLGDLASRSSVTIYGLQTLPFASGVQMPEQRGTASDVGGPITARVPPSNTVSSSLRELAEYTGGFARRSNDPEALIRESLAVDDAYYLVGYAPPPGTFERNQLDYRKVTVRVRRKGVTVLTRSGFYSVPDESLRSSVRSR